MAGETQLGTAVVPIKAVLDQLDKDLDAAKKQCEQAGEQAKENFDKGFGKPSTTTPAAPVIPPVPPETKKSYEDLVKTGEKLQKIGAGLTVGVSTPLTLLGKSSIDAASDLNESESKAEVVFGAYSQTIADFAASADKNLGLSKQAALEAMGTYGNLFTSMGMDQGKAADMSKGLAQLAADLASFNNLEVPDVLEKLRSGLVGETEPLRSLGINLTADAIEAKALAMGLGTTSGSSKELADAQSKLQAAQSKVNDLMHGAGLNSAEAAAAQLKLKGANLDVTQAQTNLNKAIKEHGKNSLEAKQAAQTLAEAQAKAKTAQDQLNVAVNGYGPNSDQMKAAQAELARAQDAVNKAMQGGTVELSASDKAQAAYALMLEQSKNAQGDFARTSDGLANSQRITNAELENAQATLGQKLLPVQLQATQALGGLASAFTSLGPGAQTAVLAFGAFLVVLAPLTGLIGTLLTVVPAVIAGVTAIGTAITASVLPAIGATVVALGPILLIIAAVIAIGAALYLAYTNNFLGIKDIVDSAVQSIAGFFNTVLLPAIQSVIDFITGTLWPIIRQLIDIYLTPWKLALGVLVDVFNNVLVPALQGFVGFVTGTLMPFLQALADVLTAVVGLAATALAGLWQNVLQPALEAVANVVSGVVKSAFQTLADLWNNTIKPALESVASALDKTLGPALKAVSSFISDTLNGVLGDLRRRYIDPLVSSFNSISNAIKKATGWLSDLASGIRNFKLPSWLTPGSPTPFELGLWGIEEAMKAVSKTADLQFAPSIAPPSLGRESLAPMSYVSSSAAGGPAGGSVTKYITIRVDGAKDPKAVARELWDLLSNDRDAVLSGGVA